MAKIPDYTKRAIDKYNSKYDRVSLRLEKGSRERYEALGRDESFTTFLQNTAAKALEMLENLNK